MEDQLDCADVPQSHAALRARLQQYERFLDETVAEDDCSLVALEPSDSAYSIAASGAGAGAGARTERARVSALFRARVQSLVARLWRLDSQWQSAFDNQPQQQRDMSACLHATGAGVSTGAGAGASLAAALPVGSPLALRPPPSAAASSFNRRPSSPMSPLVSSSAVAAAASHAAAAAHPSHTRVRSNSELTEIDQLVTAETTRPPSPVSSILAHPQSVATLPIAVSTQSPSSSHLSPRSPPHPRPSLHAAPRSPPSETSVSDVSNSTLKAVRSLCFPSFTATRPSSSPSSTTFDFAAVHASSPIGNSSVSAFSAGRAFANTSVSATSSRFSEPAFVEFAHSSVGTNVPAAATRDVIPALASPPLYASFSCSPTPPLSPRAVSLRVRSPPTVKLSSPTAESANFAAATLSAALTTASPRASSSFASTASIVSLSPLRDRATSTATHHLAHHHLQQAHLAAVDALLLQHVAAESAIELAASNKCHALPPPFAMPTQPLYRSNGPPRASSALALSPRSPEDTNDALVDLVGSAANFPTMKTSKRFLSVSKSTSVESTRSPPSLGAVPQLPAARHPLDSVAAAASIGRSTLIPELPMTTQGNRGAHAIVRPLPQHPGSLAAASPFSALSRLSKQPVIAEAVVAPLPAHPHSPS